MYKGISQILEKGDLFVLDMTVCKLNRISLHNQLQQNILSDLQKPVSCGRYYFTDVLVFLI